MAYYSLTRVREKDMAKKPKELQINRDWCKGCGICVNFCPKQVLEIDKHDKAAVLRPEDCICCKLCEIRGPDLAIEMVLDEENENE